MTVNMDGDGIIALLDRLNFDRIVKKYGVVALRDGRPCMHIDPKHIDPPNNCCPYARELWWKKYGETL